MADTTNEDEGRRIRPFAAILQEHSRGTLHEDLSRELQEVVRSVLDHPANDASGSVTLKLTIKANSDGDSIGLVADVSTKHPKVPRPATLFYGDDDGNLLREDPNQLTLGPLREVPGVGTVDTETGEVREVAAPATPIREVN